ncbi:MAG TPA: hypothetical protein VGF80_08340 [Galbitalea sp.]
MSSDLQPDERATEFRRALVATADLGPYVRRRPPAKLVVGTVVAFAIAGALTGRGIAAASKVDPTVADAQSQAASDATLEIGTQGGTLLGKPFVRTGSGRQQIELGPAPSGTTELIEGFGCLDSGKYVLLLDSKRFAEDPSCGSGSGETASVHVSGGGSHLVTIRAAKSTRFTVWISWAKIPKLAASAAQRAALADGVVTRDEVIAAFSRYEGCMGALGHPMDRSLSGITPPDATPSSAVVDGSDERCFVTEYQGIDGAWQLELHAGSVGQTSVAACLASGKPRIGKTDPNDSHRAIATLQGVLPDYSGCPWIG